MVDIQKPLTNMFLIYWVSASGNSSHQRTTKSIRLYRLGTEFALYRVQRIPVTRTRFIDAYVCFVNFWYRHDPLIICQYYSTWNHSPSAKKTKKTCWILNNARFTRTFLWWQLKQPFLAVQPNHQLQLAAVRKLMKKRPWAHLECCLYGP